MKIWFNSKKQNLFKLKISEWGMKRGKKGQFYIITAIIIISVVISFAAIQNYAATKPKFTQIYDLGKELKLESGKVYDYGIYKEINTEGLIKQWADVYANYTRGQNIEEWLFVYGNDDGIIPITFSKESAGKIKIILGEGNTEVDIKKGEVIKGEKVKPARGEAVKIVLKDANHSFNLKEGENFFFVIKTEGYITEGK